MAALGSSLGSAPGFDLESPGFAQYLKGMGRNAWAEMDPDLASMKRTGGISWSKVLIGLIVIGVVTFIAAYYVPLYRAHSTLTREHQRISEKAQTLDTGLVQAQRSLQAVEAKLKTLEDEQSERETGSAKSAAQADGVQAALASALERYAKRGGLVVGKDGSDVVVAVADALLFAPKKLDVSGQGRSLLCDVAKASGANLLVVQAFDSGEPPEAPLSTKFPTAWSLRSARAASIAEALADKCGVKPARLAAAGLGAVRPSSIGAKLPPDHVELHVRFGDAL